MILPDQEERLHEEASRFAQNAQRRGASYEDAAKALKAAWVDTLREEALRVDRLEPAT